MLVVQNLSYSAGPPSEANSYLSPKKASQLGCSPGLYDTHLCSSTRHNFLDLGQLRPWPSWQQAWLQAVFVADGDPLHALRTGASMRRAELNKGLHGALTFAAAALLFAALATAFLTFGTIAPVAVLAAGFLEDFDLPAGLDAASSKASSSSHRGVSSVTPCMQGATQHACSQKVDDS